MKKLHLMLGLWWMLALLKMNLLLTVGWASELATAKAGPPPRLQTQTAATETDDANLTRWMGNYFAVKDFECRFRGYAVSTTDKDWNALVRANALQDERGYLMTSDFHLKFRPKGRLYFLNGKLQTKSSEESEGGLRDNLNAHDGIDHRSFVESAYNGLIQSEESLNIRLITNPMHYFCADLDLSDPFQNGRFRKIDDLTYELETYFGQNREFLEKLVFHLSPEHHCQPKLIELRLTSGLLRSTYEVEKFENINGIWFPTIGRRKLFKDGDPNNVYHESLLEIAPGSLRLNQNLQASDFHFDFPPGSTYLNQITGDVVRGEEAARRESMEQPRNIPKLESSPGRR